MTLLRWVYRTNALLSRGQSVRVWTGRSNDTQKLNPSSATTRPVVTGRGGRARDMYPFAAAIRLVKLPVVSSPKKMGSSCQGVANEEARARFKAFRNVTSIAPIGAKNAADKEAFQTYSLSASPTSPVPSARYGANRSVPNKSDTCRCRAVS